MVMAILSLSWLLWLVPVVHVNLPARDADHSSVITDFILAFIPLHVMGINIRPVYLVFSFLVLHQRRNRERSYGTLELRTSMASHISQSPLPYVSPGTYEQLVLYREVDRRNKIPANNASVCIPQLAR